MAEEDAEKVRKDVPEVHSVATALALVLRVRLTDCVPEEQPDAVTEAVLHCEALIVDALLPEPKVERERLDESEPDGHDEEEPLRLPLEKRLPLAVEHVLGEADKNAVIESEPHPEVDADWETWMLNDARLLELAAGDSVPLTVGCSEAVEKGVGDRRALEEEDREDDTVEHPEAVRD